jgi:hypothetical protein
MLTSQIDGAFYRCEGIFAIQAKTHFPSIAPGVKGDPGVLLKELCEAPSSSQSSFLLHKEGPAEALTSPPSCPDRQRC